MEQPRPLAERYFHLTDHGVAQPYEANAGFWDLIDELPPNDGGWLVSAFDVEADMAHWERHPDGDEVFLLHRGALDVILDRDGVVAHVPLRAGDSMVIPSGAWHTWDVDAAGTLVVCTFGRGTEHRPR
jgi:mannose-6-phosphate isomerase-like protein (cupin superfamily)